eukprot:1997112-Heterocapsa_arctica.AAC.1
MEELPSPMHVQDMARALWAFSQRLPIKQAMNETGLCRKTLTATFTCVRRVLTEHFLKGAEQEKMGGDGK